MALTDLLVTTRYLHHVRGLVVFHPLPKKEIWLWHPSIS
jgi:hypothetical protein